jgi:imidazolonepropionase-like amidohydrolase
MNLAFRLGCAAIAMGIALPATRSAGQQRGVALEKVSVIDVRDGSIDTDRTVVVTGRRITAIGPTGEVDVARGVRRVDASGLYLIPGLWDMHVHSAVSADRDFPVYLALGITGVRNMHTTVDTALELTQAIKRRLAEGRLIGPRFIANGAVVDGPVPIQPGSVALATPEAGRAAVDSLARQGADFIKVYSRLPKDVYFAVADESKKVGIPFVGHVPNALRVAEAADAGQKSIEHIDAFTFDCSATGDSIRGALVRGTAFDPSTGFIGFVRLQHEVMQTWSLDRCREAIDALHRNGTWFVSTFVIFHASAHTDEVLADSVALALMPPDQVRRWTAEAKRMPPVMVQLNAEMMKAGTELVGALHNAGVGLLAGTDVGNDFLVPGYSLHEELELLTGAGLSPLEALQTATFNPARFLDATDSLGTIEEGKLADLVLLDANPLDDIRNTRRIRAVLSDGRYFDRTALDGLLDAAKRASRKR